MPDSDPLPKQDLPMADTVPLARLVATATAARPAGSHRAVGTGASAPVEALWRTAQELFATLATLSEDDWSRPTPTVHGSVHDVVAHLVGIERYVVSAVAGRTGAAPGDDVDHVRLTAATVSELRGVPGEELAALWFDAVANTCEVLRADADERPIELHGLPLARDLVTVFRTFELWAHGEDVCAATGRPLPRLDGPRMGLLASTLMSVLPLLVPAEACPAPAVARLVLLGPGGGVADVHLGPAGGRADPSAAPTVRLVADVVDVCRVASRRLDARDLEATVTGDRTLVAPLLAAAAAFAMD